MTLPFDPTISAALDTFVALSEEVKDPQMRAFWQGCKHILEDYIFGPSTNGVIYNEYIQSDEWQAKKKSFMRFFGLSCVLCGAKGISLEAHHRTYDRLGAEWLTDCLPLCDPCHELFHAQRE